MIELFIIFFVSTFTYKILESMQARYSLPLSFFIFISVVGWFYGEKPKTPSEFIYMPFFEGISAFQHKFMGPNDPTVREFLEAIPEYNQNYPHLAIALCDIAADRSQTTDANLLKVIYLNFVDAYWEIVPDPTNEKNLSFQEYKSYIEGGLSVDYKLMLENPQKVELLVRGCFSNLPPTPDVG